MVDYDCGFTAYCYYLVLRGFLFYKQVVHNSCSMGTVVTPSALGPAALVLGCIYQANRALMPMLQL